MKKRLDYERCGDFKTKVICDIPINKKEIYRISNKEYRGMRHVDLRVFWRRVEDEEDLFPKIEGLQIEWELLKDVIEGFSLTRDTPARKSFSGHEDNRILVWHFLISEWDCYRFYKIRNQGKEYVEMRRMMLNVDRKWGNYYRKGIVIETNLIDKVIEGLKKAQRTK